jgi:ABC-2 type transport system ATP-binding protein
VATPLLELRAVAKQFGHQDALAGVTAEFAPGTIGLVGPNGAGKTTLIRLLLGLIPATSGSVRVFGTDAAVDPLAIRERVGYMPEHDCLIPTMSGVGFVGFMGQVSGLPREVAMSRAHDVLQFVGLREERYRKISEYSVGMRQRVKLAQAIVHDPALCFLDEPTAGLDPTGRQEMLRLLGILARTPGHSFVLSTHLLGDVEGLCDQILLLNAGRSLAAGPLAPLLRPNRGEVVVRIKGDMARFALALSGQGLVPRPSGPEVRLQLAPGAEALVFAAAAESGVQVRYLGSAAATVEDLFLSLVNPAVAEVRP